MVVVSTNVYCFSLTRNANFLQILLITLIPAVVGGNTEMTALTVGHGGGLPSGQHEGDFFADNMSLNPPEGYNF